MPALMIPADGRITSQNILTGTLTGGEVQEIVSPGNAAQGNTYQVTTLTLAAFYGAFPFLNTTEITAGATSISPYHIAITDTRILVKKTLSSATSLIAPLASLMQYPYGIFVKDLKGDADSNPITLTFTGGQLCDGKSQMGIGNPYNWFQIMPTPDGTAWYQSQ